jgi:hypothetical protein
MFDIDIHFTSGKNFLVRRKDEVSARKLVDEITRDSKDGIWFDVELSTPSDQMKRVVTINRTQVTYYVMSAAKEEFALYT